MDVIKSFKVRMHMNYAAYEAKLRENPDTITDILGTFINDMNAGPKEDVIKFFNLEDEDIESLNKGTYAIGYKIVGEDADAKVIAVNIRIDIKAPATGETILPEETLDEIPSVADMLASGLATSQDNTVGSVIDTDGEVVMESGEDTPTETGETEEVTESAEDGWVDADTDEVPFEDEVSAEDVDSIEPTDDTPTEEVDTNDQVEESEEVTEE